MGPITSIISVPRNIRLGGRDYLISEARLLDIATLQAILDDRTGDPLAAIHDKLTSADEMTRQRLLKHAYKLAEVGAPVYGESTGNAYYASNEGICCLLYVALRRHQSISPEGAVSIFEKMTPGEYGLAWRIFHGRDAIDVIGGMLIGPDSMMSKGIPITWGESIDELSRERNWPYSVIAKMTLSQFASAKRHGKPIERGRALRAGEDPLKALAEWKALFSDGQTTPQGIAGEPLSPRPLGT